MTENSDTMQDQLKIYQGIVQEYERLDEEIDQLIMKNGGASKNMSEEDREKYRDLARQRRDLLNEMRLMERDILKD